MIRTILFDLDGTLIDSEPTGVQAILECTREWGVPVTPEDAASVAGRKWDVAFDFIYSKYAMPFPVEVAAIRIKERFKEIFRANPTVVPGVVDAIRAFKQASFSVALVTGSDRVDALWALEKLKVRDCFDHVFAAEDYPRSKPAPDGFLAAVRACGSRPEECLVFEDSAAGIASALAAGCPVVAITSTNHYGHDQGPAQARVRDFREVSVEWVRKQFS